MCLFYHTNSKSSLAIEYLDDNIGISACDEHNNLRMFYPSATYTYGFYNLTEDTNGVLWNTDP